MSTHKMSGRQGRRLPRLDVVPAPPPVQLARWPYPPILSNERPRPLPLTPAPDRSVSPSRPRGYEEDDDPERIAQGQKNLQEQIRRLELTQEEEAPEREEMSEKKKKKKKKKDDFDCQACCDDCMESVLRCQCCPDNNPCWVCSMSLKVVASAIAIPLFIFWCPCGMASGWRSCDVWGWIWESRGR